MSSIVPTRGRKALAAAAMVVATGVSVAACGSTQETAAASSSASEGRAPSPVAAIDSLTGNSTTITLDQGFVDALGSLQLTPGTVGTAELAEGALSFPVTGGNVTVFKPGQVSPYVIGQVQHEGSGLSLTTGKTSVELTNLNVDPGVSRVYGDVSVNGEAVVTSAYLFTLDGRTLKPLRTGNGTATLEGTKVSVSPVAAGLLNEVFETEAVTADLLVGTAAIVVSTTPGD